MRRKIAGLVFITVVVLNGVSLFAHHSFTAEFDDKKPITLKGTLTKVELTNLHGWLYLNVKNKDGKLRLLYECAPLAFLAEAAGGRASTGERRVLEVEATAAHQRCPLVIGSAADVALYEQVMRTGQAS